MPKYVDGAGLERFYGNIKEREIQTFDTVAAMQAATYLEAGMTCHTNGFHTAGDGGAAYYTVGESGTANGMDVLELQGGLVATLIVTEPYVMPEQFGAWCDGTHDDTSVFSNMLSVLDANALIRMRSDKTLVISAPVTFSKNINVQIDGNVALSATGGFVFGTSAFCYEHNSFHAFKISGDGYSGDTNAFKFVNAKYNDIEVNRILSCKNAFVFNEDKLTEVSLGQNIIRYLLINDCNRGVYIVGADSESVWGDSTVAWAEGNQFMGGFIHGCHYAGIEFAPNIKCGDTIVMGAVDCVAVSGAYDILDNTTVRGSGNTVIYGQPNMYLCNFVRMSACVFPENVLYVIPQAGMRSSGQITSAYSLKVMDVTNAENETTISAGSAEMSNSSNAYIDLKNDKSVDRHMRINVGNGGKGYVNAVNDLYLLSGASNIVRMSRLFRGIGVSQGSTTLSYSFPSAVPDTNYSVFVTPNWQTTVSVGGRSTTGFTISFGTAAPGSAEIEMLIVGQV